MAAPFIFGPGSAAKTPEEAQRLRAIADALAAKQRPNSFGTGLAHIGEALEGRVYSDRAAEGETAGRAGAVETFNGLINNPDPDTAAILSALNDPWLEDGQQAIVADMYSRETAPPKTDLYGGKLFNVETGDVIKDFGPEPPKPVETFRPMTPEEKAAYGITPESKGAWQINDTTGEIKTVGGSGQTINVGGDGSALDKKLSEKEGESWAAFLDAGVTAAGQEADFAILDELITGGAPQDPLTGELLKRFPGFDSRAAAFQSIIKRIAPTLRAPGSGATSDIEYEGFLQSLPALTNNPEANAVIAEVFRTKAEINMRRAEIVQAYLNSDRSKAAQDDARAQLGELNRISVLTPEVKQRLAALGINVGDVGRDDSAVGGDVIVLSVE